MVADLGVVSVTESTDMIDDDKFNPLPFRIYTFIFLCFLLQQDANKKIGIKYFII